MGGRPDLGRTTVTGSGPGVGQSGWLSRGISEPRSSGADCGVQHGRAACAGLVTKRPHAVGFVQGSAA